MGGAAAGEFIMGRGWFASACVIGLALSWLWANPADLDTLTKAEVPTDGPGLLGYFRARTLTTAESTQMAGWIETLGADRFADRERAMRQLLERGPKAILQLNKATRHTDVEIARRAERCLRQLEKQPSPQVASAAARQLATLKPAGAPAAILDYLPWADDDDVIDALHAALTATALSNGQVDPLVVQALKDATPARRAAAGVALAQAGPADLRAQVRLLLRDPVDEVRLPVCLALVTVAHDKDAVPVLIDLLAELPARLAWKAEDVLLRLAGTTGPNVSLGTTAVTAFNCRAAWRRWWEQNAATADLSKISAIPAQLGLTLIAENDLRNPNNGRVIEVDAKGDIKWKLMGLRMPFDAVVVDENRVLVAEHQEGVVSERDIKTGNVVWRVNVLNPNGVQRLPNGHTLVSSRAQVIEYDAEHKPVATIARMQQDITYAQKTRGGEMFYLTASGYCARCDANGKELRSFTIGGLQYNGKFQVLPNQRLLVTLRMSIVEVDSESGRELWRVDVENPTSVQRLPNGNTLVASINAGQVSEVDRTGKVTTVYKSPEGYRPCYARKR
jgi:outer membrane protein assembly factor BamB